MKNKSNKKKNSKDNDKIENLSHYVSLCASNSRIDVLTDRAKIDAIESSLENSDINELVRYFYYPAANVPSLENTREIENLAQRTGVTPFSFCVSPVSDKTISLLASMENKLKNKFVDLSLEIQNFLHDQFLLEVFIDSINSSFQEDRAIFLNSVTINNLSYYHFDPRIILFTQSALPFISPHNIRRLVSEFDSNINNIQEIAKYKEGKKQSFIIIIENIINNNISYFSENQFDRSELFSIIDYAIIFERADIVNLLIHSDFIHQNPGKNDKRIFNLALSSFMRGNNDITKIFLENAIWSKFTFEEKKHLINLLVDRSDGENLNAIIQELVDRSLLDIDLLHEVINSSQEPERTRHIMSRFSNEITRNSLSLWESQTQFWNHIEQMQSLPEGRRDDYIENNLSILKEIGVDQFISTLHKSELLIIRDFASRYNFAIMMQEESKIPSKKKKNKPKPKHKAAPLKDNAKNDLELPKENSPKVKQKEDNKKFIAQNITESHYEDNITEALGKWEVVEKPKKTKTTDQIKNKTKNKDNPRELSKKNSNTKLIDTKSSLMTKGSAVVTRNSMPTTYCNITRVATAPLKTITNISTNTNNSVNSDSEVRKLTDLNNDLQERVDNLSKLCNDLKETILSIKRGNLYIPLGYRLVDYQQEYNPSYGKYFVVRIANIITNEIGQFFYTEDGTLFTPESAQDSKEENNKTQEDNKADTNEVNASGELESNNEKTESSGNKVEEFHLNINQLTLKDVKNEEIENYKDSLVEAEEQAQTPCINFPSFIETDTNSTESYIFVERVIIYNQKTSVPFYTEHSWEVELPFLQGEGFYHLY